MNASKSASTVFGYLVSLVIIFAVWNWVALLVPYISFRRALKAHGISVKELPHIGLLQPYGVYHSLWFRNLSL